MIDFVRHECGHLVIAKSLGFKTGGITITHEQAYAELEIIPSCRSTEEIKSFIERRVIVLYAGAAAQSIYDGEINSKLCIELLKTTALDDWRKIQEYVRLLAGIEHPGYDASEKFAPKLKEVDDNIANKAGEAVDTYKALILELTDFFIARFEIDRARKPLYPFTLSQNDIDTFQPIKAAFT